MCLLLLPYQDLGAELAKIGTPLTEGLWEALLEIVEGPGVPERPHKRLAPLLPSARNSYYCGFFEDNRQWGFAFADMNVVLGVWTVCNVQLQPGE